jgi:hypothetical protein
MNDTTELHAWSARHTRPTIDRDAVHRATVVATRRSTRRHRLAERVRSVADRLET